MMPPFDIHAIANYSALRIVDSLAVGTAACAFTALALRLSRRQSAAARFAMCFLGLLAIALFPVTRGFWTLSPLSKAGLQRPALVLSESWALFLFWTWLALAGLHLLGVCKSLLHLRQLRRSCTPVRVDQLAPIVRETVRRKAIGRKVSLCTSDHVRVPTAIGLLNPAVVIPKWVMEELSAEELKQVLLHELAHLRRYDDWTNLAQQVIKSLFFFHPAVWWIEKKMAFERETACDDAVLAETESPRAYAECLAHLAERSFVQRSIALAQAALGKLSETSQRVAQILDTNRPKANGQMWKPALSAAAGVVLVCGVLISESPEWVAFDNSPSAQVATAHAVQENTATAVPVKMAAYATNTAPITYAKFKSEPKRNHAKAQRQKVQTLSAVRAQNHKTSDGGLIHLTSMKASQAPTAETLFIVIESRDPNAPEFYQIQMWRVTVLHTPPDPSTKSPNKT
jgi:beta-lactamase regulating signal transducer with metallopeptidase domain